MSRFRGRRVLVAGGAGFLGAHLCRALIERGSSVVCVDNEVTGDRRRVAELRQSREFDFVHADITEQLPDLGAIDLIFHLASIASPIHYVERPMETLRSGSLGTLRMIDVARRNGARLIFASTSEVYGDPECSPQPESYWGRVNPVGPRAVYDESKRFGEAAIVGARSQWNLDAGIVRIFNTYGPGMDANDGRAVPAFFVQSLADRPITIFGDGRQTRSLCYVSDTVGGLLSMAESEAPGPINIGNPHEITLIELAEQIRAIAMSDSTICFGPASPDDPRRRCPDIAKAQSVLDWQPKVPLDEGLRRTVDWFRDQIADAETQTAV